MSNKRTKSAREKEFFDIYLGMGESRTLHKLAEVTGLSFAYMARLSSEYGWKERLGQHKQEIADNIKNQFEEALVEETAKRFSLAERIRIKLDNEFDNIKITNPRDFKTLVEALHLLTGKPTEITADASDTLLDTASLSDEALEAILSALPIKQVN